MRQVAENSRNRMRWYLSGNGQGPRVSRVRAMVSVAGQPETFVRFIQADPRVLRALRGKDWAAFARIYNGPNYAANKYDTKLADVFKQYWGA